ncbi:hypothetical protein PVK06_031173 [Gossypium arboreum]|uniref:Uncharacterized protein n=1 Tax=Gossypium arboreum TaxID=29729 RepID=A0ABR0NSV2_GOSAR|nr:hypothetical protein PVK06_031173 [Gossypium arboreum]
MSKYGKTACMLEEIESIHDRTFTKKLEEFPGGSDTFLFAVKFCYGVHVEFIVRNIITVYCAVDYLDMTDEYGKIIYFRRRKVSSTKMYFTTGKIVYWLCKVANRACQGQKSSTYYKNV